MDGGPTSYKKSKFHITVFYLQSLRKKFVKTCLSFGKHSLKHIYVRPNKMSQFYKLKYCSKYVLYDFKTLNIP